MQALGRWESGARGDKDRKKQLNLQMAADMDGLRSGYNLRVSADESIGATLLYLTGV